MKKIKIELLIFTIAILFVTLLVVIHDTAYQEGKDYVLDNQYIELDNVTDGSNNLDYVIYIDDEVVRVYE